MITLDQKPTQSDRNELVTEAQRAAGDKVSQTVERSSQGGRHTTATGGASAAEVVERVHEAIEVSAPPGVDKQALRRLLCVNVATVTGVSPEERSFEQNVSEPGAVASPPGPEKSPASGRFKPSNPTATADTRKPDAIKDEDRQEKRRRSLMDGLTGL